MDMDIERMGAQLVALTTEYGLHAVGAVVILVIGWTVAGWAKNVALKGFYKARQIDDTLAPFLASIVRYLILIFTVIAVLNQFGVQTASIIAVLGAAGLAIGLALQGTLSNVAAGVMLLALRPFKVGDFIDASGISGTVIEIGLFTTELKTFDGIYLMAPNSELWNKAIVNYSRNPTRRLDLTIGVGYTDDIDGAADVLMGLLTSDERVAADPAPQVICLELADSSVNLQIRAWLNVDDYWGAKFDLTRRAKLAVEAAGYSIPFPQRDVHLFQASSAAAPVAAGAAVAAASMASVEPPAESMDADA